MFISILHFMMNYKLRTLPVKMDNSFKLEITEISALCAETVPPRPNVGKRWPLSGGGL